MSYNNYGVNRAKARAKKKLENNVAPSKPKAIKKKEPTAPNLNWNALDDKKVKLPKFPINWEDSETNKHSDFIFEEIQHNLMKIIAMPAGTGKTAVAISTLGKLQKQKGEKIKFIITAPSKVVEGRGWQNTLLSWNVNNPDNQLEPILVTSTDKFASAIAHAPTLAIIYRMLEGDGYLILDEVHKYKNPVAKRAKQLQKLADIKKIGLSATPLTNDIVSDASSYLIMAGYYRNKTDFEKQAGLTYLKGRFNEYLIYNSDGSVNMQAWPYYQILLDRLSTIIYRPNINLTDINMPNIKTHVIQLDSNDMLNADMRSLAKANKDRMFDSYVDYFMEVVERLHNDEQRLNKLIEIIKSEDVIQPLIFYVHVNVKDSIINELNKRGINDYQVIDGQNNFGDLDHTSKGPILVQYYSGAEGIELKTSNTTIYYQNQHSYSVLEQARARNVRRGMTHDVNQYHIIADNVIDQHVFDVAMLREERSNLTLEEIYRIALEKL